MLPIWDFLTRNDARNAIAIAAILISATVAIGLYRLSRRRKSIVYEFLSMTRLLSMQEEIAGRVRILVDGVDVQDVGLVQIRIVNTGTDPIRAADYVRPISFSVDDGVRIVEAEIADKKPESIDATIAKEDQRATLIPTLINSKESLVIKLLIANFNGNIKTDARIEGVELKPKPSLRDSKWTPIIVTAFKAAMVVQGLGAAELGILPDDFRNDYKKTKE